MARLRLNDVGGTVTTNAASVGLNGTTVTFAVSPNTQCGLPAIASPDYAVMVWEPDTPQEEITYITSYAGGSATTATITRNAEPTAGGQNSGAAHSSVAWLHGPTAWDFTVTQKSKAQAATNAALSVVGGLVQLTAGTSVVDGYTVQAGDIILALANGAQNGLWKVPASGANCSRPDSYPTTALIYSKDVEVTNGTCFGGTTWSLLNASTSAITVDTTSTTWFLVYQAPTANQTNVSTTATILPNSVNVYTGTSNVTWNLPGSALSGGTVAAPQPYVGATITVMNNTTANTVTVGGAGNYWQNASSSFILQPGQTVTLTYGFDNAGFVLEWYVIGGSILNEPVYNVILFGGDPSGAANSATAINTAITKASAAASGAPGAGGKVFLPPGTYSIDAAITLGNAVFAEAAFTSLSAGTMTVQGPTQGSFAAGGGFVSVYTGELQATVVHYTSFSGSTFSGCSPASISTTAGNAVTQGTVSSIGNVTLMGAGLPSIPANGQAPTSSVRIKPSSAFPNNGTMLNIVGPIANISVENIFFDAAAAGTGHLAGYGIYMSAAQGARFRNCFVNQATISGYLSTGVNGFPYAYPNASVAFNSVVTTATNVVTFTCTANHGFSAGEQIYISNITGNYSTLNGMVTILATPTPNTFTVTSGQTGAASTNGNGQLYFTLIGAADYLEYDYCGGTAASGQALAAVYTFHGDVLGNLLGSANSTYMHVRNAYITLNAPGSGSQTCAYLFKFCDDVYVRDTTIIGPNGTPNSNGTVWTGLYDFMAGNPANCPMAIVIDGIQSWGTMQQWGAITTTGAVTITNMSGASGVVTVTAPGEWTAGQKVTLAGITNANYSSLNGSSNTITSVQNPGGSSASFTIAAGNTGTFTAGGTALQNYQSAPGALNIVKNFSHGYATSGNPGDTNRDVSSLTRNPNIYGLRWEVPGGAGILANNTTSYLTSGTVSQLSPTDDVELTINVSSSATHTWSLTMSDTFNNTTTLGGTVFTSKPSSTAVQNSSQSFIVPAMWYVLATFTSPELSFSAKTIT